jgi:hypothetical protein
MVEREPKYDFLIYQPKVGLHPNHKARAWVGKTVSVKWFPVFHHWGWEMIKPTGHLEELHFLNWDAWVLELDRQVPACDLKKFSPDKKETK